MIIKSNNYFIKLNFIEIYACTNREKVSIFRYQIYKKGGNLMIIGIGIDLVESGRFLDWSAFKKQRIFTKKELEYADADNANAEKHLANFWAAREACLKALGTGFGDDIAFSDISVVHDDNGHPEIMIAGGARNALKELAGMTAAVHLSISDQDNFSVAMVVIEKQ